MPQNDLPVLIVGAGPSGLVTAISLARQGVRSMVIERHPSTSIFPRATGVSLRSMELFRSWGIDEAIRQGGGHVIARQATVSSLASREIVESPLGFPTEADSARVSPTQAAVSPQDHLEPVLLEHYRALGLGEVRFSTELVAFEQDEAGVTATIRDRTTGTTSDGPLSVPRRCGRPSQHRPDDARDPDAGTRRPRTVHEHPVPRRSPADPRGHRLRPVHARGPGAATGRRPERDRRPVRAGHPVAARDGRGGRRRGLPARALRRAGAPGGWRPRPRGRDPRDERLPVQRPGRGPDRRGPGRPGGRRRAPDDAPRRPWHEHGHRGCQRSRLAARVDLPRHRRPVPARGLGGGARPDRGTERRAVDDPGRRRLRRRADRGPWLGRPLVRDRRRRHGRHRGAGRSVRARRPSRGASAARVAVDRQHPRVDPGPVRSRSRPAVRRHGGSLAPGRGRRRGRTRVGPAAPRPSRRSLDAGRRWDVAEAYGLQEGGAVLVRPDGTVAWRCRTAPADHGRALASAIEVTLGRGSAAGASGSAIETGRAVAA